MASPFTPKTLSFLRALKRNNDREWFRARKPEYEQHVRAPMIELLGRLAGDLPAFAPELMCDPKASMYRIYRDTRFSADKSPLKTHVAAHFSSRAFPRGAGAGLYLEVAPRWVWMGGGLYMPSTSDLQAVREHIASTHPELHKLVTARAFRNAVGELGGDRLTRVPRGYVKDHPAAHYLHFRQFLAGSEYEAAFATSPRFYPELLTVFRAVAPLVQFLNTALAGRRARSPWAGDAPTGVNRKVRPDPARTAPARAASAPARVPMW
jgi:uncharacterized protein (TIGR02453 family)